MGNRHTRLDFMQTLESAKKHGFAVHGSNLNPDLSRIINDFSTFYQLRPSADGLRTEGNPILDYCYKLHENKQSKLSGLDLQDELEGRSDEENDPFGGFNFGQVSDDEIPADEQRENQYLHSQETIHKIMHLMMLEIYLAMQMTNEEREDYFGSNHQSVMRANKIAFNRLAQNPEIAFTHRFYKTSDGSYHIGRRFTDVASTLTDEEKARMAHQDLMHSGKNTVFWIALVVAALMTAGNVPMALGATQGMAQVVVGSLSAISCFYVFFGASYGIITDAFIRQSMFNDLSDSFKVILGMIVIASMSSSFLSAMFGTQSNLALFGETFSTATMLPLIYSLTVSGAGFVGLATLFTLAVYGWINYLGTHSMTQVWQDFKQMLADFYYLPAGDLSNSDIARHYTKAVIGSILVPLAIIGGGIAARNWLLSGNGAAIAFFKDTIGMTAQMSNSIAWVLTWVIGAVVQIPLNVKGFIEASAMFSNVIALALVGTISAIGATAYSVLSLNILNDVVSILQKVRDNPYKYTQPLKWQLVWAISMIAGMANGYGLGLQFESTFPVIAPNVSFAANGIAAAGINVSIIDGFYKDQRFNCDVTQAQRQSTFDRINDAAIAKDQPESAGESVPLLAGNKSGFFWNQSFANEKGLTQTEQRINALAQEMVDLDLPVELKDELAKENPAQSAANICKIVKPYITRPKAEDNLFYTDQSALKAMIKLQNAARNHVILSQERDALRSEPSSELWKEQGFLGAAVAA